VRRRLVLLSIATSALVLVAFLVPLAVLVRRSAADRATTAAAAEIQTVAPLIVAVGPADLPAAIDRANAESPHRITIFLGDGSVVGEPVPRSPAVGLAAAGSSMTVEALGGREVLVAVVGPPTGTAVIRAFVPDDELSHGVGQAWLVLGLLGSGLLVVSVLIADRLSRTVTMSLSAVARVSDQLAKGDLTARAIPAGPPEVHRVGSGLNHLASQIERLIANEREAAADLSHRLRTPLTALRIDAETLSNSAEQSRILADVDAVERTVNEIIRMARRVDPSPAERSCEATAVVRERTGFWSALADEEDRRIDIRIEESVTAGVTTEDLAVCVDALLGNVFAHTPEGTPFAVELDARPGGGACLRVADRGPGMPSARWKRGASRNGSTGLGLDIVHRIAAASGGGISIGATTGGGAQVAVIFGAVAP